MKFYDIILCSVKDKLGKVSSSRISSYFILISILLNSLLFMSIELINANISWNNNLTYTIPTNHIIILGLFLSHHLVLLGLKKSSDNNMTNPTISKNIDSEETNVGTDTPPVIEEGK